MKDSEMQANHAQSNETLAERQRVSWEDAMQRFEPAYEEALQDALKRGLPSANARQSAEIWQRIKVEGFLRGDDIWAEE